jgi:flagellar hook protein FlgE
MSISGMLRTSTSGMEAQSNRLSTVADNIANVSTTGYKRAYTEFSSFIPVQATGEYQSGSVSTHMRHAISEQGSFKYTVSKTDLAVRGAGFFLVSDTDDQVFMTRAGSFVPDGDGNLVNGAGFYLMGYSLENGQTGIVANGTTGLDRINTNDLALQAVPSNAGVFNVNLQADNAAIVGDTPATNTAATTFTNKTSLIAFANLGREVTLDFYTTKTADNTWELTVFDAAESTNGGFPYAAGPLVTTPLTFDPTTGLLDGASPTSVTVPVPDGDNIVFDISLTSQLAAEYTIVAASVNGTGPSAVDSVTIDEDGIMYALYENGTRVPTFQIPLATVPSVDNLDPRPGDVFLPDIDSGDMLIGFPGIGGFGVIQESSLEQSTVDLADELTLMIESERNFQVNSKVFQTASDILEVIVNLKR